MFTETDRRVELIAAAKAGVDEFLRTTRGAAMFGSRATAELMDRRYVRIRYYQDDKGGAPQYYEIKVLKPI